MPIVTETRTSHTRLPRRNVSFFFFSSCTGDSACWTCCRARDHQLTQPNCSRWPQGQDFAGPRVGRRSTPCRLDQPKALFQPRSKVRRALAKHLPAHPLCRMRSQRPLRTKSTSISHAHVACAAGMAPTTTLASGATQACTLDSRTAHVAWAAETI